MFIPGIISTFAPGIISTFARWTWCVPIILLSIQYICHIPKYHYIIVAVVYLVYCIIAVRVFIKSWKTSAVSTTVWMVETQLCKLRGTSDITQIIVRPCSTSMFYPYGGYRSFHWNFYEIFFPFLSLLKIRIFLDFADGIDFTKGAWNVFSFSPKSREGGRGDFDSLRHTTAPPPRYDCCSVLHSG